MVVALAVLAVGVRFLAAIQQPAGLGRVVALCVIVQVAEAVSRHRVAAVVGPAFHKRLVDPHRAPVRAGIALRPLLACKLTDIQPPVVHGHVDMLPDGVGVARFRVCPRPNAAAEGGLALEHEGHVYVVTVLVDQHHLSVLPVPRVCLKGRLGLIPRLGASSHPPAVAVLAGHAVVALLSRQPHVGGLSRHLYASGCPAPCRLAQPQVGLAARCCQGARAPARHVLRGRRRRGGAQLGADAVGVVIAVLSAAVALRTVGDDLYRELHRKGGAPLAVYRHLHRGRLPVLVVHGVHQQRRVVEVGRTAVADHRQRVFPRHVPAARLCADQQFLPLPHGDGAVQQPFTAAVALSAHQGLFQIARGVHRHRVGNVVHRVGVGSDAVDTAFSQLHQVTV